MVIGESETKNCPACNSDAVWRNHDTVWKVDCSGFCGEYQIQNITVNYLLDDITRRVDAMDLLREPGRPAVTLTNKILADFARSRHTKNDFDDHYPGY